MSDPIVIDYSRADSDRRMRLLEMAQGDLKRAHELEIWVAWGTMPQQSDIPPGEGAAEAAKPDTDQEAAPREGDLNCLSGRVSRSDEHSTSPGSPAATHNQGGSYEAHHDLVHLRRRQHSTDDDPAGVLKTGSNDGGDHGADRLLGGEEVARVDDLSIPAFLDRRVSA